MAGVCGEEQRGAGSGGASGGPLGLCRCWGQGSAASGAGIEGKQRNLRGGIRADLGRQRQPGGADGVGNVEAVAGSAASFFAKSPRVRFLHHTGGYGSGASLEVMFYSAAEIFPETEDRSDHAVINSNSITDYTA